MQEGLTLTSYCLFDSISVLSLFSKVNNACS